MIVSAFYLILGQKAEPAVTQVLLNQQLLLAKAEASNTTIFFEKFGDSVATLSQLGSIVNREENAAEDLDTFVEQRREGGLLSGIVLTDENGIITLNSNVEGTKETGVSLSDRKFFEWAKTATEGEYLINEPVISRTGASKDQTIVVVASPVIRNGIFTGVISAAIKLQPLVERFFRMMKISDQTQIYLVDNKGKIFYPNPKLSDPKIEEVFPQDQSFKPKITEALKSNKDGKFNTDNSLVAYSSIKLIPQNWMLLVISPSDLISTTATPIYFRQITLLILTILTFVLFGIITLRKSSH